MGAFALQYRVKNIVLVALTLGLVAATTLSPAQDKPANYPNRIVPMLPDTSTITIGRQPPDPNAAAKLCFWKSAVGDTPFGRSGFCDVPSGMTVGSACRCSSNSVGRPDGKWAGTVILAPSSDGTTAVVR
jgi:hypothetical protein